MLVDSFLKPMKSELESVDLSVEKAWKKMAPSWPLKNLVAVNPLQGMEDISFEDALFEGELYFQQKNFPKELHAINRETIKWCQALFDEGQAAIPMPGRKKGLYSSWRELVCFDKNIHLNKRSNQNFLQTLSTCPKEVVFYCLSCLNIEEESHTQFLTLLLTTLPGWASYVKYQASYLVDHDVLKVEYLAMRIVITTLLWPEASEILSWHDTSRRSHKQSSDVFQKIQNNEQRIHEPLLRHLSNGIRKVKDTSNVKAAQFVFCIDVRSEPYRRAIEAVGHYDTYSFAGFFGLPVSVKQSLTGETASYCPVLLKPKHTIDNESGKTLLFGLNSSFKTLYQSLKYNFTTPFALAEIAGPLAGLWMLLNNLFPSFLSRFFKQKTQDNISSLVSDSISYEDQCHYAENALRMIGLTEDFSPFVFLCGHGGSAKNNAHKSFIDCGACGGKHGGFNAKLLSDILNQKNIRNYLASKGIVIPNKTLFVGALHNTTTAKLYLFECAIKNKEMKGKLETIKADLKLIQEKSAHELIGASTGNPVKTLIRRGHDWAQLRPEWGLAQNAAFIVGGREHTRDIDFGGRAFLHSYDWEQDSEGLVLTSILTAPMVVAQWINSQYLFSSLDNVAYGAGNKITKNISGKIGVMQGNGSDLMHGLSLQSLFKDDKTPYHTPARLLTVVCAPKDLLLRVVLENKKLENLFSYEWVKLACCDPIINQTFLLNRDLKWEHVN